MKRMFLVSIAVLAMLVLPALLLGVAGTSVVRTTQAATVVGSGSDVDNGMASATNLSTSGASMVPVGEQLETSATSLGGVDLGLGGVSSGFAMAAALLGAAVMVGAALLGMSMLYPAAVAAMRRRAGTLARHYARLGTSGIVDAVHFARRQADRARSAVMLGLHSCAAAIALCRSSTVPTPSGRRQKSMSLAAPGHV